MRIIRLSPDYDCYPLWEASPELAGDIDPHSLPISKELCSRILAWGRTFDDTLNRDDPARSGFRSDEEQEEFEQEGRDLHVLLSKELGRDFRVIRRNEEIDQNGSP